MGHKPSVWVWEVVDEAPPDAGTPPHAPPACVCQCSWGPLGRGGGVARGPNSPVTVLPSSSSWVPVEGSRDVCNCCETGNCEPPALSRRLNPMERWQSRRFRRDAGKVPRWGWGDPGREERSSWFHHSQGKRLQLMWSLAPCCSRRTQELWDSRRRVVTVSPCGCALVVWLQCTALTAGFGFAGAAVMVPSVGTGLVCVAVAVALAAVGVAVGIARKGCTRTSAAV